MPNRYNRCAQSTYSYTQCASSTITRDVFIIVKIWTLEMNIA